MFIICWSAKGGSGTSVIVASLAALASASQPTIAVDLAGDLPAILGLSTPQVGLTDWLSHRTTQEFDDLLVDCHPNLQLIPAGLGSMPDYESSLWQHTARALLSHHDQDVTIVVDAGLGPVPQALAHIATANFLVIRPCYLALRRAVDRDEFADAVIVVTGGDRVLTVGDVQSVLKLPLAAEVPLTPDIARRVDSGLLHSRIPQALTCGLAPLLQVDIRT